MSNSNTPISVVVIDDDPLQLRLAEKLLNKKDSALPVKRVLAFSDPAEAVAKMPVDGVTAILCDYDMPDGSGVDWLPDLIKLDVGPVLLLTATGDEQVAASAFRCGVSDYLLKGEMLPDPARLRHAIADAIRRYKMEKRNRQASRELKLANINLEDRNTRLREMTDTAHRFVDNVAHEFRTPLTVIQEFASILQDGIGGEITAQQAEYLDFITAGVRDLSSLVDDFLDTTKLKARTLRVDRQAVDVQDIFSRVTTASQTRAQAKAITVSFDCEPDLPKVFCDAEKAGRVILNLVVNAIKFSPESSTIQVTAQASGNGDVQISVRDHGVGIPEKLLPEICERFRQVGDPTRGTGKGFGLGLNIARNLVWLNLGEMSIQSTPGKGSTFTFTVAMADHDHILHDYIQRIRESDYASQICVLRIMPTRPGCSADQIRAAFAGSCQSMDLLLSGVDGQAVMAIGPTEEPDRWMQRLRDAWAHASHGEQPVPPLQIDWLGSWPIYKAEEYALPTVVRNLMEVKHCA